MDITEEELRLEAEALEIEFILSTSTPVEENTIEDYNEEERDLFDFNEEDEDDDLCNIQLYNGETIRGNINLYTELLDGTYCLTDEAYWCDEEDGQEHQSRTIYIDYYYGRDGYTNRSFDVTREFHDRRYVLNIENETYLFDNIEIARENNFTIPTDFATPTYTIDDFKYKDIILEQTRLFYGDNFEFNTKDSFKINYSFGSSVKYLLVISFPIIKIKNSNNQEHLIEDLYVIITFTESNMNTTLYGVRGSATKLEVIKGYQHSHLSTNFGQVGTFCLGSGDISIILRSCQQDFNALNFGALLATIKFYLDWESLEGGPHRHIDGLRNKQVLTVEPYNYSVSDNLLEFLTVNIKHLKLKINKYIEVDENSVFTLTNKLILLNNEKKLNTSVVSSLSWFFRNVYYLDGNNSYYLLVDDNATINERDYNFDIMTYQGKVIKPKVVKSIEEKIEINHNTAYFNPNIIYGTLKELNKRINYYYLTEIEV